MTPVPTTSRPPQLPGLLTLRVTMPLWVFLTALTIGLSREYDWALLCVSNAPSTTRVNTATVAHFSTLRISIHPFGNPATSSWDCRFQIADLRLKDRPSPAR